MHFVCCNPSGFDPDEKTIHMVNESDISTYESSHDLISAEGADVIYTDVWASMGQKEEAKDREKIFADYQVTMELLKNTGRKHCSCIAFLQKEEKRLQMK